ncbi:MAG: DUF2336 domain-containing protein [Alphaproteobacteria bacterium]|nr:DUF2336 domain-containing protein [Alphaproteobacteria bacterium]
MSLLARLFGAKKQKITVPKPHHDPARYEEERAIAASPKKAERLKLAQNPRTHLEILYYLAGDSDDEVRLAVARNAATPIQASPVIARDKSVDVRLALAHRLMALLPELSEEQHSQLYAFAAQALGVLALDEVLKVRLALSSVLKDMACAPPQVVAQLARDMERQVSEPILRYCSALPDKDLLDILSEHPQPWVLEAIAGRAHLSNKVSDALYETKNIPAGTVLIGNDGAEIADDTLSKIVERAKTTPEWHRPLCLRKHLPAFLMREIVGFVDESLHKFILDRTDFDTKTRAEIEDTVKRRMRFLVDSKGNRIAPKDKVLALHKEGRLDEDVMSDALALREYDFIQMGLSLKSKLPLDTVKRMIETRSGKAVTALVWRAGLSMRFALELQRELAKVPHAELVYPRNGTDYPLSTQEMDWQIGFFKPEKS